MGTLIKSLEFAQHYRQRGENTNEIGAVEASRCIMKEFVPECSKGDCLYSWLVKDLRVSALTSMIRSAQRKVHYGRHRLSVHWAAYKLELFTLLTLINIAKHREGEPGHDHEPCHAILSSPTYEI